MSLQDLLGEAPLEGILFDLDGTLVDSVPDLAAAMDAALEVPLAEGIALETERFTALFDTEDQQEGMAAFSEKREPRFRHR